MGTGKKRFDKNTKEGENMSLAVKKQSDIDFNDFMLTNMRKIRKIANANTIRNDKGQTVISKDDEWRSEIEWDRHFEGLKKHDE